MKPGFVRPKFYHHGTKNFAKSHFKQVYGIEKMDMSNFKHEEFKTFIMTTCRIAWEQTVKAMRDYLNTPKSNLEEFLG
jgi:hypothetical protein